MYANSTQTVAHGLPWRGVLAPSPWLAFSIEVIATKGERAVAITGTGGKRKDLVYAGNVAPMIRYRSRGNLVALAYEEARVIEEILNQYGLRPIRSRIQGVRSDDQQSTNILELRHDCGSKTILKRAFFELVWTSIPTWGKDVWRRRYRSLLTDLRSGVCIRRAL